MIGLLLLGLLLLGAAAALAVRAVGMSRVGAAGRLEQINAYGIDTAVEREGVRLSLREAVAALAEPVGRLASRFVVLEEAPVRAELMSAGLYATTPVAFLGYRVLAAVFPPLFLVFVAAASGSSPFLVVCMTVFTALFG